MANEWSKVEITATTRQTKSAEQVNAEEWAKLNKEADAALERAAARNAQRGDSPGSRFADLIYGGNPAVDEKTKRKVDEAKIWESVEITATTKRTKSAEQVIKEYGDKSKLDKSIKALPSTGNAERDLENLARGNIPITGLKLGNIFGGGIKDDTGKGNSASQEIVALGGIGGMFGGLGATGGFDPLGSVVRTDASSTPSAGTYVTLANTVFSSGSSDMGETVDIYADTLNSPQNKIKSVLSDVMDVVNSSVRGTLAKTLFSAASKTNMITGYISKDTAGMVLDRFKSDLLSGVPFTKDGMTKSLFETVGYDGKSLNFKGGLKGLGESMMKDITEQIDGSTGLVAIYKGAKLIVDGDYDTAEGIFKILDNVTNNTVLSGFMDMTNKFKILNTITQSLINLGAPEYFDSIIEKLDRDDKEKYLRDNLDGALSSGDLDFILTALKHISGNWIIAHYPNAISSIAAGYTPQLSIDGQVTKEEYSKLIQVLNSIDENWDRVGVRHGVVLYDYNLFSNFNTQARMAIVAGGNRAHISCLLSSEDFAGTYDTVGELSLRYPNYPII